MKLFQQLGTAIEALWLEKNYNEDDLPAIAADALKHADLPSKLSAWDVIEWSLKQKELPPQRDLHGGFADPPITIYSGARFHIDVYFWFEATTATHQHGFCGAFQVLMGSSIHSWYEFECRRVINKFAEIGDIKLKLCEILEVGAVQEIWPGKQYIHSLFHLERPSATIVVRTDRSPLHLPQLSYHKPGLGIDPFFEQPTTTKKLQTMSALFRAKHPDADRLASELLETSDFHTTFLILSQLRALLRSDHLGQLFKLESPVSRFDNFLAIARKRHGAAGDEFRPVFERFDMNDEIVSRRGYVTNAEHRFFMALLLNIDGRQPILDLVKKRFPDADPIEKVLDWTFDLAETRVVGIDASNALGVADFGETEMFVLEKLLKDTPEDEIRQAYRSENPGAGEAAVTSALVKVRNALIFRSLWA